MSVRTDTGRCGAGQARSVRGRYGAPGSKTSRVCRSNRRIQDLIVAAVRDAKRAADDLTAERMGPLTGGAGFDIPGLPGL